VPSSPSGPLAGSSTGERHTPLPQLEARGFSKSFGGVQALRDADLTVAKGEVHGLLGENGSGKSTLIKILAGFHAPDPGAELLINGNPVQLPLKAGEFRDLHLSFVHQHLALIPSLTVLENLLMPKLSTIHSARLNWRQERALGEAMLKNFGVDLPIEAPVARLSQVERAVLAIVRAASELESRNGNGDGPSYDAGVLVLDEPTVFLSQEGRERLYSLVRDVAARGASVIFVSHDLDEVLAIADRATILRDGGVVGTVDCRVTTKGELVQKIIGHALEALTAQESAVRPHAAVKVTGLSGDNTVVHDADFEVNEGEILGVTGLVGSGFDELPYLLYGVWRGTTGELAIRDRAFDLSAMTPAKAWTTGIALIPANRQRDGSIGSLSVAENVMMQVIPRYYRGMRLRSRALLKDARALLTEYDVRPNRPEMLYQSLSGGNQQKVVLAKWLQTEPKLLLLHEPTQGVDIGARVQIFEVLRREAAKGTAVICASSDHEQLEQICDRVLIFGHGRIVRELSGSAVTKRRITEQCLSAELVASQQVVQEERGNDVSDAA
jgi:ribose transport system ATP-binding protein